MPTVRAIPAHPSPLQRNLLLAFAVIWLALAIEPHYRQDWLLENLIVLVAVPLLVYHGRRRPFRNSTCVALFAFFVLHEIGAHYTYSEVPYVDWLTTVTGSVSTTSTGRRTMLNRPITNAATSAAVKLLTWTPE